VNVRSMEGLGHELLTTTMAAPGEAVFGTDSASRCGTPRRRRKERLVRCRSEQGLLVFVFTAVLYTPPTFNNPRRVR